MSALTETLANARVAVSRAALELAVLNQRITAKDIDGAHEAFLRFDKAVTVLWNARTQLAEEIQFAMLGKGER